MKNFLLTSTLSAFIFQLNAQTTITLQPDAAQGKDAMLHGLSSQASTNFGSSDQFPSDAWTFSGTEGILRSVVGFDLTSIPVGSTINSAALSLYAYDQTTGLGQHSTMSGSNESVLQRVTTPWDESTVTWNSQPSSTSVNEVLLPASTSPTQNYTNIDVTQLVQDMVDNPSSSYGFLLKLVTESYYRKMNFCSSDHANSSLRPKLVITYTEPSSSVTCFTLQPNATQGKDAVLHGLSSQTATNYGALDIFLSDAWTFSGTPGVLRSVIDFDLSAVPTSATIVSAGLSLYAYDQSTGLGQHSTMSGSNASLIQRVTSAWDESTVTWNTQPTTTSVNQITLPATTNVTDNYTGIDVSGIVQDMVNNPSSSHGFMLRLLDETYYRRMSFASSDHTNASLHPKLEVCYSASNGVVTLENKSVYLQLFPNPAAHSLTLVLSEIQKEGLNLSIVSTTGQLIYSTNDLQTSMTIDITAFNPGIYFVNLTTQSGKISKKLIVE